MTCYDCIYAKVCDALISKGLPWKDGKYPAEQFCDTFFKNKADVVEVVRCKDCKYCRTLKDGGSQCERIDGLLMTKPNDYCSYGERKEQ